MTLPADRTGEAPVEVEISPPTGAEPTAPSTARSAADSPAAAEPAARRSDSPWRPIIARLHFYAGIFIAPFMAVAALTGLAYTFSPQLDDLIYGHELHVDAAGRTALSVADQVAAARAVHPEGTVSEIDPASSADDSTRVVLDVGLADDRMRTVFVDPYSGDVLGTLNTWYGYTPVRAWLDDTHRNLQLDDIGRYYSEAAASWLWVVVLGGLYLWWKQLRRNRRDRRSLLRRAITPDLAARKGVRRTRGWHASVGVWLAVGLLFLSATGMTWSRWAGGNFDDILTALNAHSPDVSATLDDSTATTAQDETTVLADVDTVIAAAEAEGVDQSLHLTPPDGAGSGWTVAESDRSFPVHLDTAVVDPTDGQVVTVDRFADWPFLAQVTKLGIAAHMGLLFGLINQILLAALAFGLLCVIVWGYRMWWQRRPTGTRFAVGPAPRRGGWRAVPPVALLIVATLTVAVGCFMPVLGVTLLAFLVIDLVIGGIRALRKDSPVPGAAVDPQVDPAVDPQDAAGEPATGTDAGREPEAASKS